MRRTLRLAGDKRYRFFSLLFGLPLCFVVGLLRPSKLSPWWDVSFLVLCFVMLVLLALHTFIVRVETDGKEIRSFNWLNRRARTVAFHDLSGYRRLAAGTWRLISDGKVQSLPEVETGELHSLIALKAPAALNAKRWRGSKLPPEEDFENLSIFAVTPPMLISFAAVVGFGTWAYLAKSGAMTFMAVRYADFYPFRDFFATLSLTSEGIYLKRFGQETKIAWDQVTAVFCDGNRQGRYFVVTSGYTAITIPPHIAIDYEVAKKLFYCLPDGTRLVNFDESTKRGYRKRGKKSRVRDIERARIPELQLGF